MGANERPHRSVRGAAGNRYLYRDPFLFASSAIFRANERTSIASVVSKK